MKTLLYISCHTDWFTSYNSHSSRILRLWTCDFTWSWNYAKISVGLRVPWRKWHELHSVFLQGYSYVCVCVWLGWVTLWCMVIICELDWGRDKWSWKVEMYLVVIWFEHAILAPVPFSLWRAYILLFWGTLFGARIRAANRGMKRVPYY